MLSNNNIERDSNNQNSEFISFDFIAQQNIDFELAVRWTYLLRYSNLLLRNKNTPLPPVCLKDYLSIPSNRQ